MNEELLHSQDRYLNGDALYGDAFDDEAILRWYQAEQRGYCDLSKSTSFDPQAAENYGYHVLNEYYGFRHLRNRRFDTCLALGCASGVDIAPLAPLVSSFYCVEPGQSWWTKTIAGRPAKYVLPHFSGRLDLDSGQIDLAVLLGVLHHIPNVSFVMSELVRVLRTNGLLVLREPITWMGDWRRQRPGLTANERGLPPGYLDRTVERLNLKTVKRSLCMFAPLQHIASRAGVGNPYNKLWFVRMDATLSKLFSFNVKYRRDNFVSKFGAGSIFSIYEKL